MAEGVTVANAFVQIMPSAQGAKESITSSILPAAEEAGSSAGDSIGSAIVGKLGKLSGPLMAVGGTILGAIGVSKIAGALMDIGGEFDAMRDTIIIGTGASGEALESLVGSAESIATTVPISFEEAGNIVQDVNTRMGLVGDDLENVGNRIAALGELTGKAINMDALTGSLNAFGVSGEDASAKMDYLFGVTQNTGIGFDKLTGILETNAPALQALGFSMEQSANMAGLLDKAGLDASGTMGKMGKALVELAKPGESADAAFQRVVGSIEDYVAQGDEAAALDLASTVFGTKGATQFVAAVKSGSVSLDALTDSALGAGEGIMGTMEATMDWPERWELIQNKSKEALAPLGGALMDAASQGAEALSNAIDQIDPAIFAELGEILGTVLSGAVDVLSGALTFLVNHKEQLGAFFGGIVTAARTVIDILAPLARGFINAASSAITAMSNMKANVTGVWNSLKATASDTWNGIKSTIDTSINAAKDAVGAAIDRIKGFFSFKFEWPHIPLPHFSISGSANPLDWIKNGTPSISVEWYAKGGYIDEPTLLSVAGESNRGGEFVWPEYEPYISRYAGALVDAMDKRGAVGGVTVTGNTFIVRKESDIQAIGRAINDDARRREWARL